MALLTDMGFCLNPLCPSPQTSGATSHSCHSCGAALRLIDRYRALHPIGHGSFGRTFLAVDEALPQRPRCVIKQSLIQSPALAADSDRIPQVFQQEAERLEQLGQHAQIPKLLDYTEQEGGHYLVQEFIEGPNLEQELAQTGAFAPHQIHQILQSLLPVLHFIHSHQVIHRDIKPANIIWRRERQQWVLVDFGAARQVTGTALGRTGTVVGTAEYTAPEQLRGKAVYASDLYSLGVTCLHLLTQLSPFDLYDVVEDGWAWRDYLQGQSLPAPLAQVLEGLIQNATGRRFSSAYEALKVLNPLQARLLQLAAGADPQDYPLAPFLAASTPLHVPATTDLKTVEPHWICRYTCQAHQQAVTALAFHPHQDLLLSAGQEGQISLWQQGTLIQRWPVNPEGVVALAFSAKGDLWLSGDRQGEVQLWHLDSRQLVHRFAGDCRRANGVIFSPHQDKVVIAGYDHSLQCWDLGSGSCETRWSAHGGPVRCLKFSRDGQLLLSGGEDAMIRLWDWPSCRLVGNIATFYPIFSLDISPDDRWVAAGGYDNSVKVWDLSTGKLQSIYTDHANWVMAVAYSPDGSLLASGGEDYTVKLRDPHARRLLNNFNDHSGRIRCLSFSTDGGWLVSGCTDGVIKFWEHCKRSK